MKNKSFDLEIVKLKLINQMYPAVEYQMILKEFNIRGNLLRQTIVGYYTNWEHAEEAKKNLENLIKKEVKNARQAVSER